MDETLREQRQREQEEAEHRLKMAELEAKSRKVRMHGSVKDETELEDLMTERAKAKAKRRKAEEDLQPRTPSKAPSVKEQLQAELNREKDLNMALHETLEQERAAARKMYANNPDALEEYEEALEDFKHRMLKKYNLA